MLRRGGSSELSGGIIAEQPPFERFGREQYGDERFAKRIARAIVEGRPIETTNQLAEIVWDDDDRPSDHTAHVRTVINRLRRQLDPTDADGATISEQLTADG